MHDDKHDQFVDELLGASLKRYGGEEPRAGLETRVLAGVRSRQGAARRRRAVWAVALCAGMLAAIGLVLHSAHAPDRQPVTSASGAHRALLQAAKPVASRGGADSRFWSPRLAHGPKEKPRTPQPPCGPKPSGGGPGGHAARPERPEQFPTPMPLTEQEKLLLAYVDKAAMGGLVAGTNETDMTKVSDLEISSIQIAPLEVKPLDDSQSEQEE